MDHLVAAEIDIPNGEAAVELAGNFVGAGESEFFELLGCEFSDEHSGTGAVEPEKSSDQEKEKPKENPRPSATARGSLFFFFYFFRGGGHELGADEGNDVGKFSPRSDLLKPAFPPEPIALALGILTGASCNPFETTFQVKSAAQIGFNLFDANGLPHGSSILGECLYFLDGPILQHLCRSEVDPVGKLIGWPGEDDAVEVLGERGVGEIFPQIGGFCAGDEADLKRAAEVAMVFAVLAGLFFFFLGIELPELVDDFFCA